jgi:hypothetical protein
MVEWAKERNQSKKLTEFWPINSANQLKRLGPVSENNFIWLVS